MNKVIMVGRLTKDPELRSTGTGKSVCTFTIAVNRTRKSEGQPSADFFSCVAWEKTGEIIYNYLKKGSQTAIEGRLQTRSYEDKNGERKYATEIIIQQFDFIGQKSQNADQTPSSTTSVDLNDDDFYLLPDDDDLPFD